MSAVSSFFRREPVLCIAGAAALCTAFWVPPSWDYLGYLDWRVLALLFCLMAVVSGLQQGGLFARLSQQAILRAKSVRGLCLLLVSLCFFSSMLVTNDVALLTFVPFAALVLGQAGLGRHLLYVVVLQTVAANLGSMLTPIGNPQNLYLYSRGGLPLGDFLGLMLPYTLASLGMLAVWAVPVCRRAGALRPAPDASAAPTPPGDRRIIGMYGVLFGLCLLVVARVLPYPAAFVLVLAAVALADRPTLRLVDYSLLLTFVAFFVFIGNLGRVPAFSGWLQGLLAGREVPVAVLASQVLSNVPAALLLSGFTGDIPGLIVGTNLGGLGTLIASMASLISYRQIARECPEAKGRYFGLFTASNLVFLAALLGLWALIGR